MSFSAGIKKTLDAYIEAHYKEVRHYALHMLKTWQSYKKINLSMLEVDTCINNAYLHVIQIKDGKTDENSVKSYLLNTIKYQIIWDTSLSHKQDDANVSEYIGNDEPDDDDILDKIEIEANYNLNKWCVQKYRDEIKDPVEKEIARVYFDLKKHTAQSMADYFKISKSSAHYLIRDLKTKLREIKYCYASV